MWNLCAFDDWQAIDGTDSAVEPVDGCHMAALFHVSTSFKF